MVQWRLFDLLRQGQAHLDIETDGWGWYSAYPWAEDYRGYHHHPSADRTSTPRRSRKLLHSVKTVVTFNGSSFDLPIKDN